MCGIVGIFNYRDNDPVDLVLVESMVGQLKHRGPDDSGVVARGALVLGQSRLSIIDIDGGHQPLSNEDGNVWVSFNGEIYNFQELMVDLRNKGHLFRTRCDTEVLVHGYEEYGIGCFRKLNGMFALSIWDAQKRRLVLARDPFGVKPLYVWVTDNQVVFASELKAFLCHPHFKPELDPQALDDYLTYQFVPSPRTLLRGVSKLRPGHYMCVEQSGVREGRFTQEVAPDPLSVTSNEAEEELASLLQKAVRRQMISDVPVGALLSGGVDSATVVALMRQNTSRVRSFTVGFSGRFAENELHQARRTAALLETEHHEVVLSRRKCLDTIDRAVWHLDEPIGTPSALAMYWVSALAAQHVKVVLTGQGADEPWAGYRRYRGEKLGLWYRRVPKLVRKGLIDPLVRNIPRAEAAKRAIQALSAERPLERFVGVYSAFSPGTKRLLLSPGVGTSRHSAEQLNPVAYWLTHIQHLSPLAQQLYVETRLSLPDNLLTYGDKMSMAHSLEARVPLLDVELMNFVERLPIHFRLRGWAGHKYLFKRTIARWLPPEILSRPKIGFSTPMDEWFRCDRGEFLRDRLCQRSQSADWLNVGQIEALIESHCSGRSDHTRPLYALLMLTAWADRFLKPIRPTISRAAHGCAVTL